MGKPYKLEVKTWIISIALVSVVIAGASRLQTNANSAITSAPEWASPATMAIKRVTSVGLAQSTPVLLDNLDCSQLSYRFVSENNMQSGCFTDTALGLLDNDSDTVIFNGTDEGLPLLPYVPDQVLAPWPKAMDLVSIHPLSTGGAWIGLYKNPLTALQDQRNLLGQLTAKQLTGPPDIFLTGASGARLVINPQTITFSSDGSWLVVETLAGSFMRINLGDLEPLAFAPAYSTRGGPSTFKSEVSISDDGRFIAIANDASSEFRVYDFATCSGANVESRIHSCKSYDYRPFANKQIGGLRSIRHVRFINDGLLSFEASSNNPAYDGLYELAPAGSITSLTDYIGLGDSYTSGEGAFDYLADTDSPANMCHLSRNSYPLLLTQDLFSRSGGHSVACSGAVINDVGSTNSNYKGQVADVADFQQLQQTQPLLLESVETNFVPGYIAQHRFVQRWQPRIATVSVGGDDIGFGALVQNCVEPHISRHTSDSTCYNTYEDRLELMHLIDRTLPRWIALYKQLLREAPGMQLYAIGYPQVISDTGSCGLNVQLNKSELEFSENIIDYLDQDIQKAAEAASIPYVDISQALKGHRLCEAKSYTVAVNGLTAGTDAGLFGVNIFGKESYHPNALGQSLIEQSILAQTHNLAAKPTTSSANDGKALLNAPKSGRPIYTVIPLKITSSIAKRDSRISLHASGPDNGLSAHATYTIHLDSPDGTIIGSIASNGTGDIDGSASIPANTQPGGHRIDIIGTNTAGDPTNLTQPIYVPYSDGDSDGDGIEDYLDSCPGAINSGQDADKDGIDDICDSSISIIDPLLTNSISRLDQGGKADTTQILNGSLGSANPTSSVHSSLSTRTVKTQRAMTASTDSIAAVLRHDVQPEKNSSLRNHGVWWGLPRINWLLWLILFSGWCWVIVLLDLYTQKEGFGLQ